jgi:hypothetical protein
MAEAFFLGGWCEAARAAIRFGGLAVQDVLKCTIAPAIFPRKGAGLPLLLLLLLLLSPPVPSSVPRAPA